jgi:acyl-coenzyme A thioesterase PaaI-like protein
VDPKHLERMKKMYGKAPINNLFNEHIINYAPDGQTSIDFTPGKEHCHTMMSLHGSGYFKLLDDAAFFAAQAQDDTNFIFTTSFNTYLIRAVVPGTELVSKGWVTSGGKSLIIAESRLEEKETGKLVASGSGTFQKSPHQLPAYE